MELISVENSRLVALMTVTPPKAGRPFLPDVIAALTERYRFQKGPATFDDLASEVRAFYMGEWTGVQVDEVSVYTDGVVITARAPTNFLDDFCDDLLQFVEKKFDVKKVRESERRHYEGAIVVKLDPKVVSKLAFLDVVNDDLAAFQESYGLGPFKFEPVGFETGVDVTSATIKKPLPFSLVRRVGVPFDQAVWYSAAPLKTDDHVALLENLERIMVS